MLTCKEHLIEETFCEQVQVNYSMQAGLPIDGKQDAFLHVAMQQKDSSHMHGKDEAIELRQPS